MKWSLNIISSFKRNIDNKKRWEYVNTSCLIEYKYTLMVVSCIFNELLISIVIYFDRQDRKCKRCNSNDIEYELSRLD